LFVTDGVENRAVERLRSYVDKGDDAVLVLAVGTSRGAPVRISDNHFLNDSAGRRVFAKLDLAALKSLKDAGIPITTLTLDDDDVHWVQRRAQSHLQQVQERNTQSRWIDEGFWLTIPVALLAVFWFRKGWSVRWSFSTAMLVIFPFQVGGPQHFRFIDLWLTPDQQGRYYFQRGDYKTAAERFEDPMWKGMAFVRAKDNAAAIDQFSMEDSAEAWYDQGNALAYLKRYPEAVAAYQQALSRRHPWQEAQDNLELVRSLIPAKKPDKQEEEQELPPDMKADEMKFDEKGKRGQRKQFSVDPAKMADIWMRNIQTTPADFLRRRFAIQAAEQHP
jgi:Ca-activated chloride channel family protein